MFAALFVFRSTCWKGTLKRVNRPRFFGRRMNDRRCSINGYQKAVAILAQFLVWDVCTQPWLMMLWTAALLNFALGSLRGSPGGTCPFLLHALERPSPSCMTFVTRSWMASMKAHRCYTSNPEEATVFLHDASTWECTNSKLIDKYPSIKSRTAQESKRLVFLQYSSVSSPFLTNRPFFIVRWLFKLRAFKIQVERKPVSGVIHVFGGYVKLLQFFSIPHVRFSG